MDINYKIFYLQRVAFALIQMGKNIEKLLQRSDDFPSNRMYSKCCICFNSDGEKHLRGVIWRSSTFGSIENGQLECAI